jgi:hypothetical protein
MRLFISFIIIVFIWSCASGKTAKLTSDPENFIKEISENNFNGAKVQTLYNKSGDLVVIFHKIERGVGFPYVVEFVVADVKNKNILYTDSVIDGDVFWLNDDIIRIKRVQEVRSTNENENVKSKDINIRKLM